MMEEDKVNVNTEINILRMMKNENVIEYYESWKTNNNYYIIMEYCNAGDLESLNKIR
jgi:serine/threonine-protein kinase ULK/ATG1/calcium-dependent protein kinase